jgi:hypothetical protein
MIITKLLRYFSDRPMSCGNTASHPYGIKYTYKGVKIKFCCERHEQEFMFIWQEWVEKRKINPPKVVRKDFDFRDLEG